MDFETIACFGCDTENETTSRFCETCGAPLWAPLPQDTTPEIPAPAYELWKNATDEWKKALKAGEPDILLWGHLESLLSLAISYAGSTPFPRAHAHLAIILLTLGIDAGAEREANIALGQNPNEFRAQQVRIALALNGELTQEQPQSCSPAFLYAGTGNSGDAVSSEPYESMETGNLSVVEADGGQFENSTVPTLVTEIERMLVIFRNFCDTNTDVDEYLNIADFLILSSDQIQNIPLELRAELCSAVAYTPTDMLNSEGREREVVAVLQRARRELLAFKHTPEESTARRRVAFA
jgi:hypothetical protein